MSMNVVIDGNFVEKTVRNGAQRYALEIVKELDKLLTSNSNYSIVVRAEYEDCIFLNNIAIIPIECKSAISWKKQIWSYVKKKKALYVSFNNRIVLSRNSIVTIHDIYEYFGMHNRSVLYYIKNRLKTLETTTVSKRIVTVSNFSKDSICQKLGVKEEQITVIPNAWQHIICHKPANGILEKYSLVQNSYFLFLGRLVANKNIEWIFKEADLATNRDDIFVVAGRLAGEDFHFYEGINHNIIYTGYVNDDELCSLYANCKAFLLPSLMEGFGIPPMEALYYNKPIIISNTSSLPEVYGDAAHYIDPYKYDYNLSELLKDNVAAPNTVLRRYSWEKSAKMWHELIENNR